MGDKGHLELAPLLSEIGPCRLVKLDVGNPSSFVVLVEDLKLLLESALNVVKEGLFVHSPQEVPINI